MQGCLVPSILFADKRLATVLVLKEHFRVFQMLHLYGPVEACLRLFIDGIDVYAVA